MAPIRVIQHLNSMCIAFGYITSVYAGIHLLFDCKADLRKVLSNFIPLEELEDSFSSIALPQMEDVNLVIKILQERSAGMKGDINTGQGLDLMADAAT